MAYALGQSWCSKACNSSFSKRTAQRLHFKLSSKLSAFTCAMKKAKLSLLSSSLYWVGRRVSDFFLRYYSKKASVLGPIKMTTRTSDTILARDFVVRLKAFTSVYHMAIRKHMSQLQKTCCNHIKIWFKYYSSTSQFSPDGTQKSLRSNVKPYLREVRIVLKQNVIHIRIMFSEVICK